MSNNIYAAMNWTGYRTGLGRNILGVEWVLPTGDVLKTGSLATPGAGYCWGEGPGPDARGLLRSRLGHWGALGVVTRIALKLYSWPGPRVWPTEGVQPEKKAVLPRERFKSYFISYPTFEKSVEALREIGTAEIGGWLLKFGVWDLVCWAAKTREEFWEKWESEYWREKSGHIIAIGLWGFASEKQVEYEEKVLKQIIEDTGGKLVPDEVHQWLEACMTPNCVRDTHRCRFIRIGGRLPVNSSWVDSLDYVLKGQPVAWTLLDKLTPPLEDMHRQSKIWPMDFSRYGMAEADGIIGDKSPEFDNLIAEFRRGEIEQDMETSVFTDLCLARTHVVGPVFANVHLLLTKIKKGLDPNYVATPGLLIRMEEIEKAEAKP